MRIRFFGSQTVLRQRHPSIARRLDVICQLDVLQSQDSVDAIVGQKFGRKWHRIECRLSHVVTLNFSILEKEVISHTTSITHLVESKGAVRAECTLHDTTRVRTSSHGLTKQGIERCA